ncbi:MAG: alpha/beta hydrolase [Gammaproteobacteria bacterium]|nr:alpha/beta hydrolase [Gammaproteobacteria bacterium]
MLFITNRTPRQSPRTRVDRAIGFDIENNTVSNSVYFCRRNDKDDYTEMGSQGFMGAIRESDYQQILIYIHGFSNLPESDIFPRALKLQEMFDAAEQKLTLVIPLIWPCDADVGVVKDYWDDQKSADMSAFAFARVMEKFMAWRNSAANEPETAPCLKRINMLAHSMGNRVLRETLVNWNRYDLASGVPLLFRNTFLVAADIVNESLTVGQPGELIAHASRNVAVYFASDDLALRASKVSNLKNKVASRRLGHTGPEDMDNTPRNVYAIDCDDFNNQYDMPTGHSYFLTDDKGQPGAVFQHILKCIQLGRVFPDDENRRMSILKG